MLLAANLGAMIFIIVSMVTLGLSTTVSEVLAPLKDKNLISRAILANFILVPVIAYLLVTGLHLPAGIAIGLILVGTAAGSPFLARANQIPADKRELAGGLGILLTIFSVFYIPIIAPFLIPVESKIDPVLLFITFVIIILIPLFIAMYLRSGREEKVARALPWLDRTSYGAFFATFIGVIFVFSTQLTEIIGYGGFLAIILFVPAVFGIGYLLGGYAPHMRAVLSFGTAQRGLSVALVFPLLSLLAYEINPGSSVYDPTVLLMIVSLGIAGLIILMVIGKRLAKQGSQS
jgi:BASS family bile acid:Na+ symporter